MFNVKHLFLWISHCVSILNTSVLASSCMCMLLNIVCINSQPTKVPKLPKKVLTLMCIYQHLRSVHYEAYMNRSRRSNCSARASKFSSGRISKGFSNSFFDNFCTCCPVTIVYLSLFVKL